MVRDSSEISGALATGEADTDIAEAEDMIARKAAKVFKLKGGAKPPQADVERAVKVAKALAGRAEVRIDLNQVWDETTANRRSEEHTSELQSLQRISYAVFCLTKKKL